MSKKLIHILRSSEAGDYINIIEVDADLSKDDVEAKLKEIVNKYVQTEQGRKVLEVNEWFRWSAVFNEIPESFFEENGVKVIFPTIEPVFLDGDEILVEFEE